MDIVGLVVCVELVFGVWIEVVWFVVELVVVNVEEVLCEW